MRKLLLLPVMTLLLTLFAAALPAQTKQRIRFAAGKSSAVIKGSVRGYAYKDYVLRAAAGQMIDVRLTAAKTPSVFTVLLPDRENLEGAAEMNDFTGELPAAGDYIIRVGMMRAAARRRGSVSNYTLKISIR